MVSVLNLNLGKSCAETMHLSALVVKRKTSKFIRVSNSM